MSRDKYAVLLEKQRVLITENGVLRQCLKDAEKRLKRVGDNIETLQDSNEDLSVQNNDLKANNDRIILETEAMAIKNEKLSAKVEKLLAELASRPVEDKDTIKELKSGLASAEERLYASVRHVTRKEEQIEDLQESLQHAKEKYSRLKDEAREAAKEAYDRHRETERNAISESEKLGQAKVWLHKSNVLIRDGNKTVKSSQFT